MDRPDGGQKPVATGDVLPDLQFQDQILLWVGKEVVAADGAEHHRSIHVFEVVHLLVVDVITLP
jgi:hypothetical protein